MKKIIDIFKNLDNQIKNIMITGFVFSFIFCIISTLILLLYKSYMIPLLYYSGTILFKTALMFFVDFIILGLGFDTLRKQKAL